MVRLNEYEYTMSPEELLEVVDQAARSRLGIGGALLIERYRTGRLSEEDRNTVTDVLVLIDLLPDDTPVA